MAGLEGKCLDRYEVRRFLGRGGMADVYQGYDPHFEREVAIKVFKRDEEALLTRFIREARLMASLHHAHLLPVYDTGASEIDGAVRYYMVMPLMTGGTLRNRIRQGPLTLKEACTYLRDISSALDYIHAQGIIHRDIKPSNVLLDSQGFCYLADFGIARITMSDGMPLTTVGNVLGTVDYVAPELFEANRRADARSDLYSLGVLLFEMITGHLPFVADNQLAVLTMQITRSAPAPSSLLPTLSPQIDQVVLKALEKKPELRYGSASELADAFCQAAAGKGLYRAPVSKPEEESTLAVTKPASRLILPPSVSATPNPSVRQAPAYVSPPDRYQGLARQPVSGRSPTPDSRRNALIVTILALLTLLVVLIPIIFVLMRPATSPPVVPTRNATAHTSATNQTNIASPQPTANAQLTATVSSNATATALAHGSATATQQTNATATAVEATATVQPTATPDVIQTVTAGNATYRDALNNPSDPATQAAQWDQNATCLFKADGYHVTEVVGVIAAAPITGCHEAGAQYANAAISVDVTILSGASAGLFFRITPQTLGGAYSGYLFEIDNKGNYRIYSSSNFLLGTGNAILRDWTSSSALKAGAKNTLQVLVKGSGLSFYANGVFLGPSLQDSSFTTGNIGFLATAKGGANADAVYSNLSVFTVS